jgi:hypothetical protein
LGIREQINILLVLAPDRIEVERGRIRYVAAVQIGNDGDVITYLILVGPSFLWINASVTETLGDQLTPASVLYK